MEFSQTPRQHKFLPKNPPKRKSKPSTTKAEVEEDDAQNPEAAARLRRMNENLKRRENKDEMKSASVQVAFGPAPGSLPSLRSYGVSKGVNTGKISDSASKVSANGQNGKTPSTVIDNQGDVCMIEAFDDATDASTGKIKGQYVEPWDYQNSYYPTTLPLRKLYSGDPEQLDEGEFGAAATNAAYDENTINDAKELGLLEESQQEKMLLFQIPPLPLVKQPMSRKGKEKVGMSTASEGSVKGCTLEELSRGYMGKLLVYKSGAVKLKLGEVLLDVSSGLPCNFPQYVAAMNTAEKHCCFLGQLGDKKAVVSPNVDFIDG